MEGRREKGGRAKVENTLACRHRSLESGVCLSSGWVNHSVKVSVILRPPWSRDAEWPVRSHGDLVVTEDGSHSPVSAKRPLYH